MKEERVFFQSGEIKLEGLYQNFTGNNALIVSHPHPQHGGDMLNNVVETIVESYHEREYTTLRYNFRGVGASEGEYDNGVGEQEDVRAAIEYLLSMGKDNVDLAGYSFGSWVNALGLTSFDKVSRMIMISPPVEPLDFSPVKANSKIKLIIAGSNDDIARPEAIKPKIPEWNPDAILRIIEGADHFYWGKMDEIKSIIRDFI